MLPRELIANEGKSPEMTFKNQRNHQPSKHIFFHGIASQATPLHTSCLPPKYHERIGQCDFTATQYDINAL